MFLRETKGSSFLRALNRPLMSNPSYQRRPLNGRSEKNKLNCMKPRVLLKGSGSCKLKKYESQIYPSDRKGFQAE